MPFTRHRLEWTTIAGLGLCTVAAGSYWLVESLPALLTQLGFGTALIGVKDSWLVEQWLRLSESTVVNSHSPAAEAPRNSESFAMPKLYQTLADITADLPDLVTVLQDFVALDKLIVAKDVVGIIGSYSKWEADVVKLVNDIRGSAVVPIPAVADPSQTTLAFAMPPVISAPPMPSGSVYVGTAPAVATSLAAQAGLPESTR